MEEKILKELDAINLQLKGINQNFEKIDQRFEVIDQKLKKTKEEICSEIRQEFEEKLDSKLENLKEFIMSDVSNAFKENMNVLNDRKNEQQNEIVEELREHKIRTLKGVRAFERALTV